MDAALLQSQGNKRVCAYAARSCSQQQIETMKRHRIESVVLCGDPDAGGQNGTDSNLVRLMNVGMEGTYRSGSTRLSLESSPDYPVSLKKQLNRQRSAENP